MAVAADLTLVHLYPDLLRTYGDRGNVLALQRRAEWRGFSVDVVSAGRGEPLPARCDIVLIGGGTDRVQEIVGEELASRGPVLHEAAAGSTIVIGICGGYQFLGHRYVTVEGAEVPGLGLLDVETVAGPDRLIGRVKASARLWERAFDLAGFENHAGLTTLMEGAVPLATDVAGGGNNGLDGTEGAVQGTVVGTYLHGPVLAINAEMADAVLERALARTTGGAPLAPLPDELEREAHRQALALKR